MANSNLIECEDLFSDDNSLEVSNRQSYKFPGLAARKAIAAEMRKENKAKMAQAKHRQSKGDETQSKARLTVGF